MVRPDLRGNAFLIAAVTLPILVVGFFLLATALPRWTVPPPRYDLLLGARQHHPSTPRVSVEFTIRDGAVYAVVRPVAPNTYPERATLWLFGHETLTLSEIPVDVPEPLAGGESAVTVPVKALTGRRVLAQTRAPDGYELQSRSKSSPGVIGELFGMRRYGEALAIANRGRVVPVFVPERYEYRVPEFVGWIVE
jgi:hypothetical protein